MKPNIQRAKLAKIFLYIVAVSSFIFSLHYIMNVFIIYNYEHGDGFSLEELNTVLVVLSIATFVYAASYLLCALFFILWFIRAYRNIQMMLPKSKFAYRPWAAAVTWFVPVWNLFGPYKIATNLFDKAEDFLISEDKMVRNKNFDIVKGTWWALWIFSAVLIRISAHYATKNLLSISANIGAFIGFVLSIVCAAMAIQMITNYSKMEKLMNSIDAQEKVGISTANDELLDAGI